NLSNTEMLRPLPTFSEHTQSDTKWLMPIPVTKFQNKTLQNEDIEME
ncbi:7457_t:CDS:1, partial [Funneliformis caledonium]